MCITIPPISHDPKVITSTGFHCIRTRRKALWTGTRTNNKHNPHMTPGSGIELRTYFWGERSHHCAIHAPQRSSFVTSLGLSSIFPCCGFRNFYLFYLISGNYILKHLESLTLFYHVSEACGSLSKQRDLVGIREICLLGLFASELEGKGLYYTIYTDVIKICYVVTIASKYARNFSFWKKLEPSGLSLGSSQKTGWQENKYSATR